VNQGPADATSKLAIQAIIILVKIGLWPTLIAFTTAILASNVYLRDIAATDQSIHRWESMPLGLVDYGFQAHRWTAFDEPKPAPPPATPPAASETASSSILNDSVEGFGDFGLDAAVERLKAYACIVAPRLFGVLAILPIIAVLLGSAWCLGRVRCAAVLNDGGAQKPHLFVWSLNGLEIAIALLFCFTVIPVPLPFLVLLLPIAGAWFATYTAATNKF